MPGCDDAVKSHGGEALDSKATTLSPFDTASASQCSEWPITSDEILDGNDFTARQ